MSRIRTIKPEFWEDEKIGLLSHGARLLFLCCLNLSDDEGRLRWNTYYLASSAFMYDEIKIETMEKWMKELVDNELIYVYQAGEAKYHVGLVKNFKKHQVINRPQPSKFPPPNDHSYSVSDSVNGSVNDSQPEREREREKEREKEEKRDTDVSPEKSDSINPDFHEKKETHPPVAPPPPPKNPEKPKKAAPDFDMTNIPVEYIPPVQMWLEYKRGRGQTYKTQKSFELMVEQLQCFSRGDPKIAEMIVKQSMANNWAGLFELKNATTNGNSNRKNDEDFARELATVALEVEYEHLDRGRITEDEFRRRTGIEPVSRQYR